MNWLFRRTEWQKIARFCWVPSHIGITGNDRESGQYVELAKRLRPTARFTAGFSHTETILVYLSKELSNTDQPNG